MVRNSKGITLIALVITIIVLLILAGVSLNLIMGEEGILGKATTAVDKTEKARMKEELEMQIMDIQMEQTGQGNKLTLEFLKDKLNGLGDILAELGDNEVIGEYKDYEYTIDDNFKVEIGEKITGVRPSVAV